MKKGQVFIRAKSPSGKWGNHDVFDLTETSFRAFVLDRLLKGGHLVGLRDDLIPGDHIEYESTVEEQS